MSKVQALELVVCILLVVGLFFAGIGLGVTGDAARSRCYREPWTGQIVRYR